MNNNQQQYTQHNQMPSPSLSRNYNNTVANTTMSNNIPYDSESIQQLKVGMAKIMQTLERLETRLNRVEATTTQILKQQQETLSVPFMSQSEIDKARIMAEQMEQDSSVAKQLQAAYNKEVEVRKNVTRTTTHLTSPPSYSSSSYPTPTPSIQECPICGARVLQSELEVHVDNCLEQFSDDPKKESQVKETKKKIETGFFGKFFKSTKTETTKVVTQSSSPNAPLLSNSNYPNNDAMVNMPSIYPAFAAYPTSYPPSQNSPQQYHSNSNYLASNNSINNTQPVMMPMYMYPSYPNLNPHIQQE